MPEKTIDTTAILAAFAAAIAGGRGLSVAYDEALEASKKKK